MLVGSSDQPSTVKFTFRLAHKVNSMTDTYENFPLAATCGVLVRGGGTAGVIAVGADASADFEKQEFAGENQNADFRR